MIRLDTDRLILRPLNDRDADDLYPIISDPEVTNNLLIPYPFPEERMLPWIRDRREALRAKERYILTIVLKETGKAIGVCGLVGVSWEHMNAELVYWLGKEHWGKGYTTEAASELIRFGFQDLGFERIAVGCFSRNKASVRVIEKLGFKYEGLTRHEFIKNGEYQDVRHFGMLREEFLRKNTDDTDGKG